MYHSFVSNSLFLVPSIRDKWMQYLQSILVLEFVQDQIHQIHKNLVIPGAALAHRIGHWVQRQKIHNLEASPVNIFFIHWDIGRLAFGHLGFSMDKLKLNSTKQVLSYINSRCVCACLYHSVALVIKTAYLKVENSAKITFRLSSVVFVLPVSSH
jgi:hypothetical protein